MRRPSLQQHWQAALWMALVVGLCWALVLTDRARLASQPLPDLEPLSPAVSAAPPRASASPGAMVAAYAEVDGRAYSIVLGAPEGSGSVLWSAAISTEGRSSEDAGTPPR